jgi:hypothetical protein
VYPQVHADQVVAAHVAGCFLTNFAYQGLFGRFPAFEVSARLGEHDAAPGFFLDHQVPAFMAYDGRYRQVGLLHAR